MNNILREENHTARRSMSKMDPKEHRDDLHIHVHVRGVIGKRYVKKHDASVADKWAVHVSVTCALAD